MSKIKVDLDKFKHESSDGKTTTLRHKDGHMITLAHKSLNPEMQKALSQMSAMSQINTQHEESEVKQMAEGGEASPQIVPEGVGQPVQSEVPYALNPSPQPGEIAPSNGEPTIANTGMTRDQLLAHLQPTEEEFRKAMENAAAMTGSIGKVGQSAAQVLAKAPPSQFGRVAVTQQARPNGQVFSSFADKMAGKPIPTQMPKKMADGGDVNFLGPMADTEDLPAAEGWEPETPYSLNPNPDPRAISPFNGPYRPTIPEGTMHPGSVPEGLPPGPIANTMRFNPETVSSNLPSAEKPAPFLNKFVPPMSEAKGIAEQPASMPQPHPQGPGMPQMDQTEASLMRGVHDIQKGIELQSKAQQQKADADAQILARQQNDVMAAKSAFDNRYQELDQERKAHMADIQNGHIDPNQYWTGIKDPITGETKGSHSQIASAIGMILAGFNPTGNPNAAIQFLNKQMDNNIDAQKANLNSKNNLLQANLRQFGNLKDATDMTRIMQSDLMQRELQEAAAKSANPMAKAAALQASGQLQMQTAPMMQQFAMRRAMMSLANGGQNGAIEQSLNYLRVTDPKMYEQMSKSYVPGYQLSAQEVPAKARDEIISRDKLRDAAQDLYSWSKQHTGSFSPSAIAIGKQKAQLLQSLYREGVLNTVYREGEQPLLDKVVNSDPTSFFNSISTLPKLQEIIKGNELGRSSLLRNYGLRPAGNNQPQMQQAAPKFNFKNRAGK